MNPHGKSFFVVPIFEDGQLQAQAKDYLGQIELLAQMANDSRKENYTRDKMQIEKHLIYTALVDGNGELVTACGLFNGDRYPKGVYRCMNRTFVNPKYRVGHGHYPALATRRILPYQVAKHSSILQTLFVSREHPKAQGFLKRWIRIAGQLGVWRVPSELFQVVPGAEVPSAYQSVAILHLDGEEWNPPRWTTSEWYNRAKV